MGIEYTFDKERGATLVRGWGYLNLEQLLEALMKLNQDPDFNPDYQTLCDYTEVSELDLDPEALLAIIRETQKVDQRAGRTAMIMSDDRAHQSIAKLYEMLAAEGLNEKHRVFNNTAEAEVWLGLCDVRNIANLKF